MTIRETTDSTAGRVGFWGSIQEALRGTRLDFTEGSLVRAIVLLAIPMMLEMASQSVFAICDAFFVARLGSEALASLALTESLLTIVYSMAAGLSMATAAVVARRFGEKDARGGAQTAVQAMTLGGVVSLVLGALGVFLAADLLQLMGASEEVVGVGTNYCRVMLGGTITVLLLFLINAAFRGAGDASVAMRSLWLANGINLILDPCLIFGLGPFPELGLVGAAIATTIGRGVGILYQLWKLGSRSSRLVVHRSDLTLDMPVMVRLLRVSFGGIAQMLIGTTSWVGLIRILATFGSQALAGYAIALRIVIFALLPAFGLSNAAATLVGQNLGARKPERAERAVWLTGLFNMIFLGTVAVVFLFFARPLVAVFTDQSEVLATGIDCLRVISYGYVFYAWGMVAVQAFNGAGDTLTPTLVNLFCFWLFQIPLAYLLAQPLGVGPGGVFWAIAVSYSLSAVVGLVLFRRGRWKKQQV